MDSRYLQRVFKERGEGLPGGGIAGMASNNNRSNGSTRDIDMLAGPNSRSRQIRNAAKAESFSAFTSQERAWEKWEDSISRFETHEGRGLREYAEKLPETGFKKLRTAHDKEIRVSLKGDSTAYVDPRNKLSLKRDVSPPKPKNLDAGQESLQMTSKLQAEISSKLTALKGSNSIQRLLEDHIRAKERELEQRRHEIKRREAEAVRREVEAVRREVVAAQRASGSVNKLLDDHLQASERDLELLKSEFEATQPEYLYASNTESMASGFTPFHGFEWTGRRDSKTLSIDKSYYEIDSSSLHRKLDDATRQTDKKKIDTDAPQSPKFPHDRWAGASKEPNWAKPPPRIGSKTVTQTRGTAEFTKSSMKVAAQPKATVKLLEIRKAIREKSEAKAAKKVEKTRTGEVESRNPIFTVEEWSYSSPRDSMENDPALRIGGNHRRTLKEADVQKQWKDSPEESEEGLRRMLKILLKPNELFRITEVTHASSSVRSAPISSNSIKRGLYMCYTISQDASAELSGRSQETMKSVLDRKRKFRLES